MAGKKSSSKRQDTESKPEVKEEAPKEEAPKEEAPKEEAVKKAPPPPVKKPAPVAQVTFDRWFNSMVQKGKYKPHHKAGMVVFMGKSKGRRSVDAWNKLFEKY